MECCSRGAQSFLLFLDKVRTFQFIDCVFGSSIEKFNSYKKRVTKAKPSRILKKVINAKYFPTCKQVHAYDDSRLFLSLSPLSVRVRSPPRDINANIYIYISVLCLIGED